MKWNFLLAALASWLASGCMLFGGLRVEPFATSAQKPSNVAVYFTVTRSGGVPVSGLTPTSFTVVEDGTPLGADQTRQILLPRDVAAVHRALLLVDMSGPVTEGKTREQIAGAAAWFVSRAKKSQPVSVFAFDGGASIRLVGDFPEGPEDVAELPELVAFSPADPSSNLHAAVVEAVAQLDARLMATQKPVRIGSLVVFARGPDLAGRVTEAKMVEVLENSAHHVFAIGVKDAPGFRASRIGESGTFIAENLASLSATFDDAGTSVANTLGSYYLLAYCSPARAGTRQLRVEVRSTDENGGEVSGRLSTQFDANGFGSGCDPNTVPRFVVQGEPVPAPVEAAPPAESNAESKAKPARKAAPPPARAPAPPPAQPPPDEEEGDDVAPPPSKPGYAQ